MESKPRLIVKSPTSTGFSEADEDIPFLSIASVRSGQNDVANLKIEIDSDEDDQAKPTQGSLRSR